MFGGIVQWQCVVIFLFDLEFFCVSGYWCELLVVGGNQREEIIDVNFQCIDVNIVVQWVLIGGDKVVEREMCWYCCVYLSEKCFREIDSIFSYGQCIIEKKGVQFSINVLVCDIGVCGLFFFCVWCCLGWEKGVLLWQSGVLFLLFFWFVFLQQEVFVILGFWCQWCVWWCGKGDFVVDKLIEGIGFYYFVNQVEVEVVI